MSSKKVQSKCIIVGIFSISALSSPKAIGNYNWTLKFFNQDARQNTAPPC